MLSGLESSNQMRCSHACVVGPCDGAPGLDDLSRDSSAKTSRDRTTPGVAVKKRVCTYWLHVLYCVWAWAWAWACGA